MTLEQMTFKVFKQKVDSGHFKITAVCNETNEKFEYIETDMTLIDALDEDGDDRLDAMFIIITKAVSNASNK
jgi:hypothetical protein